MDAHVDETFREIRCQVAYRFRGGFANNSLMRDPADTRRTTTTAISSQKPMVYPTRTVEWSQARLHVGVFNDGKLG